MIKERKKDTKICFIGGTSLFGSKIFNGFKKTAIKNTYGRVNIYYKKNIFLIQRHEGNIPPHMINCKAYFQALFNLGVKKIISINSVGALKKTIKVPSIFMPDDFIGLWDMPTFFNQKICHTAPQLSLDLRKNIIRYAEKLKIPIQKSGIYFQATGPRLETAAEIKMIANFADAVGMTLSSEATLAAEKEMEIASICTVDNYANGIKGEVDCQKIYAGAKKNLKNLEKILRKIIEDL